MAVIETLHQPFNRIRRTNTTDNAFPTRAPQLAEPVGTGNSASQTTASSVIEMVNVGTGLVQNGLKLKLYGAGADNATFSVRIYGWDYIIEDGDRNGTEWDPTLLCELACTVSAAVHGVAGRVITDTDLYADTITGVSIDVHSPADDAHAGLVVMDFFGLRKIEAVFKVGTATNANGIWSKI